ncbi:SMC4 (YLR086W) [Zygosaccharomyces parabailii]|nr:SMC4 (YLR086W) [Zygosaccharomyces parabailii]
MEEDNPLNKRQKLTEPVSFELQEAVEDTHERPSSQSTFSSQYTLAHARTPRKLVVGNAENRYAHSQPPSSSSLQAPSLQPPRTSSRGRGLKTYSQSPPRSPGRSPTRRLELLQISPVKHSRLELQKRYDAQQNQARQARLCIDLLVLQDFKSYAGRQVVGPFHSSFSAVVGPNGSGKSNVIDSMLFVFGFRANKMRQDRLSDLIHKSEEFPKLNCCSVEVHFRYVIDEPTGQTSIDEEKQELIITRKAFRNNTSKYYINEQEASYGEVIKLLKKEGVDLDHKRFLILQGEVENIAQMRSKAEKEGEDGLLEYLEDIIGTAKYKPLIEENLTKIEALNDLCIEKENRFQIVDREKNSLENGKEEALLFLENERKLTIARSTLFQYHILNNNVKLVSTLEKITTLNQELEKETLKHKSTKEEIGKLQTLGMEYEEKIKSCMNEEKTLLSNKRKLEGKKVLNEEKKKNLCNKREKAQKLLSSTCHSITSSESKLAEFKQYQIDYDNDLRELNAQITLERADLEKIKFSLKGKTSGRSDEISKLENELEPWNAQLQEKQAQIQLAESQLSLIRDTETKLAQDISSLKDEISHRKEQIVNGTKDLADLQSRQSSVETEIVTGEKECSSARIRLKEMQNILNSQRQKAIDSRSALSNAENKSKVLTSLSRLQKSGRISGFYGRLGDLGVIDEKYDVAISTACPRLEDIVVDSVECGQQCIEYLRRNKLGYARFILLDKLRSYNMSAINTPENVPRLFDLIRLNDQKFAPAFYSVLSNTLGANDLKQANRVAYGRKRFRVVTLDGKLIDISGTMSGGGNRSARGLMQVGHKKAVDHDLYNSEEVAQLEISLAEKEKNFRVASDTLFQMEERLKDLKDQFPTIETKVSHLRMEIESWNSDVQLKEARLKESQNAQELSQEDNSDLAEANERLSVLRNEYKGIQDQMKSKKNRIDVLKNEIMEIGGTNLKLQSSKVDSVMQRIDIVISKQKKEKSSIKKIENELKKSHQVKQSTIKDIEYHAKEIDQLVNKLDQIRESLDGVEHSLASSQTLKEELNEYSRSIREKINDMNENISIFKSFEMEITTKLEKLTSLSNHIKAEIKQNEKKLSELKIRDVTKTLLSLEEETVGLNNEQQDDPEVTESALITKGSNSDSQDAMEEQVNRESSLIGDQDVSMEIDSNSVNGESGLPQCPEDELRNLDLEELERNINDLQNFVDSSNADIDVLEEYARRLAEFKKRKLDLNQVVQQRDTVKNQLDNLKKNRFDEFMQGFGIISMTLKEMYQMITMGGNAELELVDTLDPFSEGVTFSVMPPKKSWRNITNLSGGEKTLSSLALVFALHKYKPTPLYVMDEIDAALDFRNVSIVANYIKERTKNAQFIVISLRNNMFELAQQLIGIYKRENKTKSATIKNTNILDIS